MDSCEEIVVYIAHDGRSIWQGESDYIREIAETVGDEEYEDASTYCG